ncbi:hypothetical protein CASFOL_035683 [Castilleja foliolosa]|uniref:Uncharacterized protein n=1 Tax=Castilleja foliolosa TaxID=1961234 RepID=A0ABD3BUW9_9LAMI
MKKQANRRKGRRQQRLARLGRLNQSPASNHLNTQYVGKSESSKRQKLVSQYNFNLFMFVVDLYKVMYAATMKFLILYKPPLVLLLLFLTAGAVVALFTFFWPAKTMVAFSVIGEDYLTMGYNIVGAVIMIVYISIYIRYCSYRKRRYTVVVFIALLLFFGITLTVRYSVSAIIGVSETISIVSNAIIPITPYPRIGTLRMDTLVPAHVSAFETFYALFQAIFSYKTRKTPMFASSMVVLSFAIVQLFCHYHLTLKLLKKAVPTATVELEVVRAVNDGDVESIASNSKYPKELTALIEQISGSEEYKRQYEELEVQKAEADEKVVLAYQKRKTISAEKKQKKLQKEEAEKHLKLQEQLKELKQEHFLWQLLNIQKDTEKANEDMDDEENSLKEIVHELENYEGEAKKKNKEQAGYLKEIERCQRKITEKQTRLDKQSELNDLRDVTKQLEDLREKSQDAGGKLQLVDIKTKEEAGMKTAKLKDEKEILDRQQNADIEAHKNLEENVQQLENRKQELESQEQQMQTRLEKILDSVEKHRGDLKRLTKEQREMKDKLVESRQKYDMLKSKISDIDDQLRELKADRHEK